MKFCNINLNIRYIPGYDPKYDIAIFKYKVPNIISFWDIRVLTESLQANGIIEKGFYLSIPQEVLKSFTPCKDKV